MKAPYKFYLFFFFSSFIFSNLSATVYTSKNDGNWNTPTNWTPNGVPGPNDEVIIGNLISVNSKITIQNITVSNFSNSDAGLILNGTDSLIINGNLTARAENFENGVAILISNQSIVQVNGNVTFERSADNVQEEMLLLQLMGFAKMKVISPMTLMIELKPSA